VRPYRRLDRDRVHLPLEIRYLQPGDRFWPTGAPGAKKLQDFLVDRKIPRWLRPYLPLVLSQGQIIWIPGLRLAEAAKLTTESQNLLELEVSPGNADTRRIWEMLRLMKTPA
jgi:tRNA(Ile)-lysidine synthase